MKHIVVFGAGKSAGYLIEYLNHQSKKNNWLFTVVDSNKELLIEKTKALPHANTVELNIENEIHRKQIIATADVVISLLPPQLHYWIALDCIEFKKHLLTASYIDESIKKLAPEIKKNNLLFLYEMGLDPGIDHMSAMQLIDNIRKKGGVITSFKSHCGGLVAPESDDNVWHYKISWNPRNIVMAGKAGARYKQNNEIIELNYTEIFKQATQLQLSKTEQYSYYANRDSLSYMPLYQLQDVANFIRTTLRHSDFIFGWNNIIQLQLTNEEKYYKTDGMSIANFFKLHFDRFGFNNWLHELLKNNFTAIKNNVKNDANLFVINPSNQQMYVDEFGALGSVVPFEPINETTPSLSQTINKTYLTIAQLFNLGLADETLINKGFCSAAEVLQFIIEHQWTLEEDDKDMVVMVHEIEYRQQQQLQKELCYLKVIGENKTHTAMAKTVGLPLGIAAVLLLQNKIQISGLHLPILPEIYNLVLQELESFGIVFIHNKQL